MKYQAGITSCWVLASRGLVGPRLIVGSRRLIALVCRAAPSLEYGRLVFLYQ